MPELVALDYIPVKPQMAKDLDRMMKKSEELALDRVAQGKIPRNGSKDVFSFLIGAKDPESDSPGMSMEELTAEAGVLMVAGMVRPIHIFTTD